MTGIGLRQLACFAAVADEMNFGRAAKRLHMSQPPLTRQIQALERALDVQLFTRGQHGVVITASGKAFLPEAQSILARVERAAGAARRAARGETRALRRA